MLCDACAPTSPLPTASQGSIANGIAKRKERKSKLCNISAFRISLWVTKLPIGKKRKSTWRESLLWLCADAFARKLKFSGELRAAAKGYRWASLARLLGAIDNEALVATLFISKRIQIGRRLPRCIFYTGCKPGRLPWQQRFWLAATWPRRPATRLPFSAGRPYCLKSDAQRPPRKKSHGFRSGEFAGRAGGNRSPAFCFLAGCAGPAICDDAPSCGEGNNFDLPSEATMAAVERNKLFPRCFKYSTPLILAPLGAKSGCATPIFAIAILVTIRDAPHFPSFSRAISAASVF